MGRTAANNTPGMPKAVYYRCIWTVRDMNRLKALAGIRDHEDVDLNELCRQNGDSGTDTGDMILISEAALDRAASDLKCIEDALQIIPEVYRKGVVENIIDKTPFSDIAHPNTWKKWKQTFIYELARNMHLI